MIEPDFTHVSMMDIPPEAAMDADLNVRVFVIGTTPLPFLRPFSARFDTLEVVGTSIDGQGTGFTGYLAERPPDGAHLIVEFHGQEPIDTGLVFRAEEPPIA